MNNYYQDQYGSDRVKNYYSAISRTYGMMSVGLGITFVSALLTALFLPGLIFSLPLAIILLVAQVVTVIAFSATIRRASTGAVIGMYVLYSLLTGLSISYIFALYHMTTIFLCFAAASLAFAILALMGHNTRRDLSGFGRFFLVGLIGVLVLSVVGYILPQTGTLEIVICCVGLVLFLGITAYDTQKIRRYFDEADEGEEMGRKMSVYFAMQLYLDFMNIFLYVLRLFGRSRD